MSVFLDKPASEHVLTGTHFFVIRDGFPVSPGHLLIVSKVVRPDFFALTPAEQAELPAMIEAARAFLDREHAPDGYNIGMNCGIASGQTIPHFHCHVIPRYTGDVENPRGGVRGVIPAKQQY